MDLVIRGKRIVIGIIAIILLIDVVTIVSIVTLYALSGNMGYATQKIVQGSIRLLLEIIISICLYRGHNWSKWILVVLLGLGGIISLFSVVPIFMTISVFGVVYLILGIVYIAMCITLIASKAVKAFMRYQKDGDIYNYESSNINPSETIFKD